MKKIKMFIILTLLFFIIPLPVQAAEFTEIYYYTPNSEISPKALIISTNVIKKSEKNIVTIIADIVTNDGTGKIIDIRNIKLDTYISDIKEISLSHGEIWENGSYATVTITYRDKNNNICTDIAKFYPYGN